MQSRRGACGVPKVGSVPDRRCMRRGVFAKRSCGVMLLLMSSGSGEVRFVCLRERGVDLAGDVALQAADDLALGLALAGAPRDVLSGRLVPAHADEDDAVEGGVGLAVAAAVEPVADRLARGGRD